MGKQNVTLSKIRLALPLLPHPPQKNLNRTKTVTWVITVWCDPLNMTMSYRYVLCLPVLYGRAIGQRLLGNLYIERCINGTIDRVDRSVMVMMSLQRPCSAVKAGKLDNKFKGNGVKLCNLSFCPSLTCQNTKAWCFKMTMRDHTVLVLTRYTKINTISLVFHGT